MSTRKFKPYNPKNYTKNRKNKLLGAGPKAVEIGYNLETKGEHSFPYPKENSAAEEEVAPAEAKGAAANISGADWDDIQWGGNWERAEKKPTELDAGSNETINKLEGLINDGGSKVFDFEKKIK